MVSYPTALQEAAIYVREGEDNDKFHEHPSGKRSKLAYSILHHPLYHVCSLLACTGLLLLTLFEQPAAISVQYGSTNQSQQTEQQESQAKVWKNKLP